MHIGCASGTASPPSYESEIGKTVQLCGITATVVKFISEISLEASLYYFT